MSREEKIEDDENWVMRGFLKGEGARRAAMTAKNSIKNAGGRGPWCMRCMGSRPVSARTVSPKHVVVCRHPKDTRAGWLGVAGGATVLPTRFPTCGTGKVYDPIKEKGECMLSGGYLGRTALHDSRRMGDRQKWHCHRGWLPRKGIGIAHDAARKSDLRSLENVPSCLSVLQ